MALKFKRQKKKAKAGPQPEPEESQEPVRLQPPTFWWVYLVVGGLWSLALLVAREQVPLLARWPFLAPVFGLPLAYLLGGWFARRWERFYLRFTLPVEERGELDRLFTHYQAFRRGHHGPALMVRHGLPLETYRPKAAVGLPKLLVMDGQSAVVYTLSDRTQVLGPGVHFLRADVELKAFVDLREYRITIPFEETEAQLKDRVPIRARLFLIVHLDDFSIPDGWDRAAIANIRQRWRHIYGASQEALQRQGFPHLLGFGHPRSVLRAYGYVPVEEMTLPWWTLAREKALQVWREKVAEYTLDQLFPPAWKMDPDPDYRTGFEKLRAAFSRALTQPGQAAFDDLLEKGLRVRVASIAAVQLRTEDERNLMRTFWDPVYQYYEKESRRIHKAFEERQWLAQTQSRLEWLLHIARLLQEHPDQYPRLREALAAIRQGAPGDFLPVEGDEETLREALHVMLNAWQHNPKAPLTFQDKTRLLQLLTWLEDRSDGQRSPT